MLRGPTDSTSSVALFDGSILATAAVSAPEAMVKTVGAVLAVSAIFPTTTRDAFETFRVWQDNDASVRGAAEVLICHPNTVRHRLRESRNVAADPSRGQRCRRTVFGIRSTPPSHVSRNPSTPYHRARRVCP